MRGYFTGIVGLLIVFLASSVSASYITMQTTMEINSTAGTINVTNNGDESAYRVQIISELLDNEYKSEIKGELKVGESFSAKIPIDLSKDGMYPLLVTIHYQDANGFLFSALVSRLVEKNVQGRSEITVELNDAEIEESVKVPVKITNFGEEKKEVSISLFMSGEFTVKDNNQSVSVGPKSHEEVFFKVENFAARSGSTYAFYAITEYDLQDGHYSAIDAGGMRVVEKQPTKLFDKKVIMIALAVIVLIFIILQFKRKK